jgi:hypothetical protein
MEVATEELDRDDWWASYRKRLEHKFEQDQILIRATAINKLISLCSDAAVAAPDKWQPGWTIETNVTGLTITAARELGTLRAPACPSTRPPQS